MVDKEYYFSLCQDAELNQETYIAKAKSQCVRWEFTELKRYDITPFWFERNLEPRSHITDSGNLSYGFNLDGELCLIQFLQERIECIERTEERIINRRYSNGKVDSIEELMLVDGMPVKYVEFIVRRGMNPGEEWHFEEDYVYEDNRVVEIKRTELWDAAGNTVRAREYQIEYDKSGVVARIKENGKLKYSNIDVGQAKQIRDEVKKKLIKESIETIKKIGAKIQDDLVCFVGIYLHDEPFGVIDPVFHPGLQSIRDEQLEAGEDLWTIWNAGEHPVRNQESLANGELQEKFEMLMQFWQMNTVYYNEPENPILIHHTWWGESKALWQEVAMALNQIDWNGFLPVTETFVIFADEEAIDIAGGDLAKSVPDSKLRILEGKKLLADI